MLEINPLLLWALAVVFAALLSGTVVRIVALRGATADVAASRLSSLRTWWVLTALLAVAVICGESGVLVLLAVAAAFSLWELIRLVGVDAVGWPTISLVFAILVLYYVVALAGHLSFLLQASPLIFLVLLGGTRACLGITQGYLRTTAAMFWGLMLFVCCLSHAAMLFEISSKRQPPVGSAGWFLFLVLLTETNDIMQAITGRRLGKRKITPRVSPNKSLEGLLGGILITVALAMISAPWLTSFTNGHSFATGMFIASAAGLLISLFGFLGDINMSATKRDAGVKDGSRLLPGHGGMIDRIDSLTFTAPVFYYFVRMVT